MVEFKKLVKENALLFITFGIVVFSFIGYHIYRTVDSANYKNYEYSGPNTEEDYYENKVYEANQYKLIVKDDQALAEYYLRQLVDMWINNPGELYEKMTESSKSYYESKEAFVSYITNFITSFTKNSTVQAYEVKISAGSSKITILTNENMEFILKEKGINNYEIDLMSKI